MSAKIAGATTNQDMEVDTTPKAGRVILYDSRGNPILQKPTYRAVTTSLLVTAAGTAPFLIITGSGTKAIRIQRIELSGVTLTAVAYMHLQGAKYSTNATGGTSSSLPLLPLDSNSAAATAVVKAYTAAPTAGTKIADAISKRFIGQATTVAASALPEIISIDFRNLGEQEACVLRGATQEFALYWGTAPATTPSLLAEIEFTEE